LKVQKSTKKKEQNFGNPVRKIKFKFDRAMLNTFIRYIYSDSKSISKMNLSNLNKLLEITDEDVYIVNRELYTRLTFAKKSLEAILMKGLVNRDSIIAYAREMNNDLSDQIIQELDQNGEINEDEIRFVTKAVSDRLQYCFIMIHKEIISKVFYRLDTGDYKYLKDIIQDVKDSCNDMMNDIRKADTKNRNETFSLDPDVFESLVTETVNEATNPASILVTGLKTLNLMLSPGYMPGRLYLYLG